MKYQVIWTIEMDEMCSGEIETFTTTEHFSVVKEAEDRFEILCKSDIALTVKMVELIAEYDFERGGKI